MLRGAHEPEQARPVIPAFSGSDLAGLLRDRGFEAVGQQGAAVKLRRPGGAAVCVPMVDRLAPHASERILRQAGVSYADLARLVARQLEQTARMGSRESPSLGRHL